MEDIRPKILVVFRKDKGELVPEAICQISQHENEMLAKFSKRIEDALFKKE